jgi:hypothetical protein
VELNLGYRRFCCLSLEDQVPDHSTVSVNRHDRFRECDIFRQVFESVVRGCMRAGLVGGEGFAVDASVIEADASRFQRVEGAAADCSEEQRARQPVREYLAALEGEPSPANPDREPKALSPSDPSAAWTTRGRHKVMFGYSLNYLIDMEGSVILDVEATPTRISKEVDATGVCPNVCVSEAMGDMLSGLSAPRPESDPRTGSQTAPSRRSIQWVCASGRRRCGSPGTRA